MTSSQRILMPSDCWYASYPGSLKLTGDFRRKKSLSLRMWPDSQHMLRQIDGIGPKKVDQLKNAGIQSIGNLREASTTKIEAVAPSIATL